MFSFKKIFSRWRRTCCSNSMLTPVLSVCIVFILIALYKKSKRLANEIIDKEVMERQNLANKRLHQIPPGAVNESFTQLITHRSLLDDDQNPAALKTQNEDLHQVERIQKPIRINASGTKNVYQKRRETMLQACAKNRRYLKGNHTDTYVSKRINIQRGWKIAYCRIQKVASTFWTELFDDVNHHKADRLADIPLLNQGQFMKAATSFIFVREPYGRLLSAFVDKLFSPNALFWNIIGKYAIGLVRADAGDRAKNCGHNLSFREFVKYVIHAEAHNVHRDGHFTPEYDHCQPCKYQYDIIGKMETIKDDTMYILDKIGGSDLREKMQNSFRRDFVMKTIDDQIYWLFHFREKYRNCMTFLTAQQRMWKKFQIRGVISKDSKYPVKDTYTSERITRDHYRKYLVDAIGDAANKDIAYRNKEEALIEAYSTVDREDLERLSEIFQPDCDMFGYDCRPDKIFKQTSGIRPWYFAIETA